MAITPQGLYDRAWRLISAKYVDDTQNQQNWQRWRHKYDSAIKDEEDAYIAIGTMVDSLGDVYTKFLTPKEYKEETESIKGSLNGIGVQIGVRDGKLLIIAPLEDTPGERAGLKSEDEILEIDGKSTKGIKVEAAADQIRGPEGTEVKLLIKRKGEENKYLCISDWHTRLKEAYKATEHTDGYDGVILLGDAAPGLQYEEEAAEYIVKFGGDLTKGEKPVIYARGNHETRGKYASELGDALGLGDYYTDIKVGNRRFIVLDSAEDKEDSHPEYGGMADYSAYRERMVEWLEGLNAGENEEVIVICHDYEICREKELSERAIKALKNLGAKVILCGHYHEVGFGEKEGIPYYIDGGHTDNGFAVSTVEFRNGEILLNAVNGDGENVGSYKIS